MSAIEYKLSNVISKKVLDSIVQDLVDDNISGHPEWYGKNTTVTYLDHGYYSTTYKIQNGRNRKYALTTNWNGSTYEEDMKATWLLYCVENQHNPHVPRIHYLYVCEEKRRYICIQEYLYSNQDIPSDYVTLNLSEIMEGYYRKGLKAALKEFSFMTEQLYETAKDIRKIVRDSRKERVVQVDLHNDNWMVRRGSSVPVITDPICG